MIYLPHCVKRNAYQLSLAHYTAKGICQNVRLVDFFSQISFFCKFCTPADHQCAFSSFAGFRSASFSIVFCPTRICGAMSHPCALSSQTAISPAQKQRASPAGLPFETPSAPMQSLTSFLLAGLNAECFWRGQTGPGCRQLGLVQGSAHLTSKVPALCEHLELPQTRGSDETMGRSTLSSTHAGLCMRSDMHSVKQDNNK